MELKLLGTHEKYVICDRQFALLGSHNVLSSLDTLFALRETGWKTSDQSLIEEQIDDFMNAPDFKQDSRLTPNNPRTFLCALTGKRLVLLHAFKKKSRKTPRSEIDIAARRRDLVIAKEEESNQ